ncbi:MAG: ComEC/Rec2 family competence protein, partial [Flavobacteriales bacterium]
MNTILQAWRRAPMFQSAIWFGLGVLSADMLWLIFIPICVGMILAFQGKINAPLGRSFIGWLSIYALGCLLTFWQSAQPFDFRPIKKANVADTLMLRVIQEAKPGPKSLRFQADVMALRHEGQWLSVCGKTQCYIPIDTAYPVPHMDHVVLVCGKTDSIIHREGPFGFNAQTYWNRQGVAVQTFAKKCVLFDQDHSLQGWFMYARSRLIEHMKAWNLDKSERAVLSALLLGATDEMDKTLSASYNATGTVHVLAVSGMHIALVYIVIAFLLRHLFRSSRWRLIRIITPIALLWMYAFLTGLSPSVVRSACMCTMLIVAEELKWSRNGLNSLGASGFVMLAYDPMTLYHIGFQLSFLAVFGMMAIQPLLMDWWRPTNRVIRWIWESVSTCVAAQLATLPVLLVLFGQFPSWFLIANLLLVTLSTVALYVGLLALVLLFLWPDASALLGKIAGALVYGMNQITICISHWPYAMLDNLVFSPLEGLALAIL